MDGWMDGWMMRFEEVVSWDSQQGLEKTKGTKKSIQKTKSKSHPSTHG
jgi:hypothetical protein